MGIPERTVRVDGIIHRGCLAGRTVIIAKGQIGFVQLIKIAAVAANGHAGVGLHKTVDGNGALLACGNRINGKARAGVHIAAHKDIRLGSLVSRGIGHSALAAAKLHGFAIQQAAPLDALANAQHNIVTRQGNRHAFIIGGGKAALGIVQAGASFQHHAAHMAILCQKFFGAVSAADGSALFLRLGDLFSGSGHLFPRFQADHRHIAGPAAQGNAGGINGNIAAADHHGFAGHFVAFVPAHSAQQRNGGLDARSVLAGNPCCAAALAADGEIERLVPLGAQLGKGNVLANFHTAADGNTQLPQDVNFRINHIFFQLKAGDAVPQHAARVFVFLKYSRAVALQRKEVRAGKPGRAAADDCNFLRPRPLQRGLHHRRNIAVGGVQVLLGHKLFHGINGHCLVHGAAGAGILAPAVADAPAHGGEGVLLFDQRQCIAVAALRSHFQVALHRNVGGAGGFAGGGAGIIAVDAVFIAVVHRPFFGAPLYSVGQFLPGVLHRAVFGAQLLAQLNGTGGAELHAAATGNAVLRFHFGNVSRAAHVGGVEQLAGAQGVADVDIAVADGKNLVLAVNVGDLVHKAVVLGFLQDPHHFVIGHIMALVGFHQIVRHIAHADAPVIRVIAAAFAHGGAGHTAGTGAGGILAMVFFQPVGDVFDIQRVVFGLDGFFDRDHVHANACAAWGHHGGNVFQRQKGHPLKKGGHFGVVGNLLFVHVKELGAAGHKHGQNVLFFAAGVLPVVFQQANAAHLIQQGLQLFGGFAGSFFQFRQGHWLAHLHFQGNIGHFVSHNAGQTPIFGVLHRQAAQLGGHTVGDHLPQLHNFFPRLCVLGDLERQLAFVQWESGRFAHGLLLLLLCACSASFELLCRRSGFAVPLCLPRFHLLPQPIGPFGNALAGFGADGDDLCVGVAHGDIFPAFVHIEIKIRQNVNFVDKNHVAHLKHQGVLQWLIVPFGHG